MTALLEPDLCVIGAGSAGLSVAAGAVQMGASVVLVESGKMGGDCLNSGCVPSKSLLAAAGIAQMMRDAEPFGIARVEPRIDFRGVRAHVHGVIAGIAPHDSVERFTGLGVRVIQDRGRFQGPDRLEADGQMVRPRRFVVATGSRPVIPSVPGLAELAPLTNETVFDLDTRPQHLLILGAGPIGCELGQAFRRLGAEVTIVDLGPLLPRDDPELAALVRARLAEEGVRLVERAQVKQAEPGPALVIERDGVVERLVGSHLLVAAGRRPEVDGLGLDAAGIEVGPKGIKVDARLRTTNRRAFAIGDVAGGPQFTHVASYHAGIVIRNALFRLPARASDKAVPRVTYTQPELAAVGLSEEEARQRGLRFDVVRWPFADNDRARTERQPTGLVKALVGRRGRILGAAIVGNHAGELILPWVLAVEHKLKLGDLANVIAPYPTLSEVTKRAAGAWYAPRLFSDRTRWLVRLLARLG